MPSHNSGTRGDVEGIVNDGSKKPKDPASQTVDERGVPDEGNDEAAFLELHWGVETGDVCNNEGKMT